MLTNTESCNNVTELILLLGKKCTIHKEKICSELDLSLAEFNALETLLPGEKMLYSELSSRMDISPSRGSRIIFRLVENGFVISETNLDDRRSHLVSLSSRGIKIKENIELLKNECETKIIGQFSKKDITIIKDSLNSLIKSLDVIQENN